MDYICVMEPTLALILPLSFDQVIYVVVRNIQVVSMKMKSLKWPQIVMSSVLFLALSACQSEGKIANISETQPGSDLIDQKSSRRAPGSEDSVEVFFTPNPQGHTNFIQLVQKAQKSIDLAMFRITDMEDAQALIAAVQRKVRVRALVDGGLLQSNRNTTVADALKAGGVELKPSSKAFSITHEKAMVIDGDTAMISTINLTNAFKTTRGIGVVSKDAEVVQEFEKVFEADWQNADQDTKDTPALNSAKLLWSPVNAVDRLVALIQSAQKNIEVYVENFADQEISKALIEAASRGVQIRVLTPLCDENPNPFLNVPMMKNLESSHIQARLMKYPSSGENPYIHAKSILVDRARAYVGSMNFSWNSLHNAREVGIIFSNSQAVSQIEAKFDQDWSLAIAPPDKTDGLCPVESKAPSKTSQ